MSTDALELFYKKVQEDHALEAKAAEALGRTPGEVVALARQHGFEFSEGELVTALSGYAGARPAELSDADLDMVAGGTLSQVATPGLNKETMR